MVLHAYATKQWEKQQEMLKLRQASPEEREKYFKSVRYFSQYASMMNRGSNLDLSLLR